MILARNSWKCFIENYKIRHEIKNTIEKSSNWLIKYFFILAQWSTHCFKYCWKRYSFGHLLIILSILESSNHICVLGKVCVTSYVISLMERIQKNLFSKKQILFFYLVEDQSFSYIKTFSGFSISFFIANKLLTFAELIITFNESRTSR